MDENVRRKLDQFQRLVSMKSGERGVPVSLQFSPTLGVRSRTERRQLLEEKFDEIRARQTEQGVCLDLGTISVSGQTVEGTIPLERFDEIEKDLAEVGVRVDVLFPRRATL